MERAYTQAEIARRRDFLTRTWRGEQTEPIAFQYVPDFPKTGRKLKEYYDDPDAYPTDQLLWIEECAKHPGDHMPVLVPYTSCTIIASAFGCPIHWADDDTPPWAMPLISDPSEALHLRKPSLDAGELGIAFERARYAADKYKGLYPLRMVNIQGPIANAGEIWNLEDLLMGMRTDPREVHATLDVVTDLMINVVSALQEIAPDQANILCHPDWIPPGEGIGIADDHLATLSPALYEEFAIPYNARLAEAFGGVHLHSCGNFEHNFPTLLKQPGLKGVNFEASDNDCARAVEIFSGRALLAPYPGLHCREKFGSVLGFVQHLIEVKRPDTAMIVSIWEHTCDPRTGKWEPDPTASEAAELLARLRANGAA